MAKLNLILTIACAQLLLSCDTIGVENEAAAPKTESVETEIRGSDRGVLILDIDEDDKPEDTSPPAVIGSTEFGLILEKGGNRVRCAVIIGDNSKGIGPKDARDFQTALQALPEWRPPNALYQTIFANASNRSVRQAVKNLHNKGCIQQVFFYSGHGSNKRGDLAPADEEADNPRSTSRRKDEYLSLRNRDGVKEAQMTDAQRVFDDELGEILRDWQISNRISQPVAGSGGRQRVYFYPEMLVILHACRSGGFVGGSTDLDVRLRDRFEILMGSREAQKCYALDLPGNPQNSFFVGNLLAGMSITPRDRAITGRTLFDGADNETTRDARQNCRAGTCRQNPQRFTSIRGNGTITLHSGP